MAAEPLHKLPAGCLSSSSIFQLLLFSVCLSLTQCHQLHTCQGVWLTAARHSWVQASQHICTAGSAQIVLWMYNNMAPKNSVKCHSVMLRVEDLQHGSLSALCKPTSSLWQAAATFLSVCLPVSLLCACLSCSLLFCLRQLVHLCGHPSVCWLVYQHCLSVCNAYLPYPSPNAVWSFTSPGLTHVLGRH